LIFSERGAKYLNFYGSNPNPGAGIGHQIGNWISGYWYSQNFKLNFVHFPFHNEKWDTFLGLGESEFDLNNLLAKGYSLVRLPLFNEFDTFEIYLQKKIIQSYNNKKVIFVSAQDQGYKDQIGPLENFKIKFKNAKSRENDKLKYDLNKFNIALHIRRGDIVVGQINRHPNLLKRWLDNKYFLNALKQVLSNLKTENKIMIYLFSEGVENDFQEFKQFSNLQYCLDWSDQDCFLHMIMADLLITSKSSFSYNAALLSDGILVCPKEFWHGYPETENWFLCDKNGFFDQIKFKKKLNNF